MKEPRSSPRKLKGLTSSSPKKHEDDAIQAERRVLINALKPVVSMLGGMIGPDVEVVLHDLTQPERSVIAIANGHVSARAIGSSILSGPKDDEAFAAATRSLTVRGTPEHSLVQSYPSNTLSGRRLRSSTVIFRDANGEPFAALCLNADTTQLQQAHSYLDRLLYPTQSAVGAVQRPAIDVLKRQIIEQAIGSIGTPVAAMTKDEKVQVVRSMMQRGMFVVKGGVEDAAAALAVTRFTIYNYLAELRRVDASSDDALGIPDSPVAVDTSSAEVESEDWTANPKKKRVSRRA